MTSLEKLRRDNEKAEAKAQKLMADKDKLREKLRAATDEAAAAQKRLLDGEAAHALAARDDLSDEDKQATADRLGLELP